MFGAFRAFGVVRRVRRMVLRAFRMVRATRAEGGREVLDQLQTMLNFIEQFLGAVTFVFLAVLLLVLLAFLDAFAGVFHDNLAVAILLLVAVILARLFQNITRHRIDLLV